MVKLGKRGGNGASQKERGGGGESAGREKRKPKEVCIKTRSTSVSLACSKRSDSGERCEVKKGMKSRGGLGREVRGSLSHLSPSLAFIFSRSFYFAPLPTIWTPGTGYSLKFTRNLMPYTHVWKRVHFDAFKPSVHTNTLSVFIKNASILKRSWKRIKTKTHTHHISLDSRKRV